ncbi:MAG TPA: molecular chaperone HtpG [Fibrobacteria bacterium]|nr:molecular chaperone HtpG [Fibrobacteria bacterium]
MTTQAPEKMEFQTEVKQLLHLMIHALYSNREIFLRELVSNASDALDKARFEAVRDAGALGGDAALGVRVEADKENGILRILDNGIGMSRDEIIRNIGTIASSGTKRFVESLTGDQKKDANLIGQFGVGFYSAFMVADRVSLVTRRLGEEAAWRWESTGDGTFTLAEAVKEGRGTVIELHLKDDAKEFLDAWRIRSIVRKYSGFLAHPVTLLDEKGEAEVLNDRKPLWLRAKSDVTPEEYKEFYKHLDHGDDEPLAWSHNRVEGTLEFSTLLYLPAKAPYDLFHPERPHGLSLYVKRVFIMNDCKELLPPWLRFVRGVVDSEDLPLNVSREILQKNAVVDKIRESSVTRVLNLLETLAKEEPAKYETFWKEFGSVLKEGFHMNWEHLDALKRLVRFGSSRLGNGEITGLADYIANMKGGQKDIYYLTAENRRAAEGSPHLEVFRKKGIEVLYLVDPIDEWVTQALSEFDGKKLVHAAKGALDLGELSKEEKAHEEEAKGAYATLAADIAAKLPEVLKEVRVTSRLSESPCCLVADENELGSNLERILKMSNQAVPESKRILEINPDHPIIRGVKARFDADASDPRLPDWYGVLVDQALLAEGSAPRDPAGYVAKVNGLLGEALVK